MPIIRNGSLSVADSVIACLICVEQDIEDLIVIATFSNGREQGYAVSNYSRFPNRSCCVAENRNSDDIVVYFTDQPLTLVENHPTEWGSRRWFKYNQCYDAAKFIYGYLLGEIHQ